MMIVICVVSYVEYYLEMLVKVCYYIHHLKAINTIFKYVCKACGEEIIAFKYCPIAMRLFIPDVAAVRRKMKCQFIVIIVIITIIKILIVSL
jgi:hypothetical protein